MAANFQNMGGAGQMMPQQMQQQQQQQQQQQPQQGRPQQQVASAQIQQLICTALQNQPGPASGWQAQTLLQERLGLVYNIIGNLRLASQNQPNPPTLQKMCEIGLKFERDIFEKSPDKAHYKLEVQNKLNQLLERRNQNQANLQQSINAQAQAQQQAQSQQMMMNQNNGMQGQVPRNIPQQPQQGFHHLQHQMQASPLPGQQMPMGIPNQGMPPNMTPNQQQQFQMAMQQRAQQQPQQHQNGPARPQQNGADKFTNEELARVNELCSRMMAEASEEEKIHLRNNLQQRMNPGVHQRYLSQNVDPLQMYYRNQAQNRVKEERQRAQAHAQAQAQFANSQQPPNMPVAAPAMQQQRSMQPSPMNGPQPQVPGGGNPDFGSFTMENIIGQQQQAGVMAQEAGQMVVPVSGSQRNGTPQPGGMPGQPMNVMDQRSLSNNPNASRQQQQQILNAQQQQQQRLQHAALQQSQQSQAQIRANAQAKAQQIALHGQPGGMGPGPVPPQQSPAMNTLNTPLRTPSQQMNHVEPLHANPNAQFGQALDPRFNNQVDQRQLGAPNTLLQSMLRELSADRQQQLQGLPPDKLNEVVTRWHQQRQQGLLQAGQQAGRPMQMPGNNQVRPGQPIPQPGQFNPQNPANQFMMANPTGQRTPQGGMSQQQQMLLQQHMAKVQQQQRPLGQVPNEQQQRLAIQLDNLEFPQGMLAHPNMPRQIPPELKKWGQVKQWAMQNQLGAEIMENIKKLQGLHYQNIIRQRNQHQQNQAGSASGGPQGVPAQAPMVPPGMAAPVAPMGQNPMQVANGMSMAGPGQPPVLPTQEQIQQLRQHPTGKMAGATDDQIRQLFMRMQAGQTPQQQQQLRHNQMMQMQQMQMANQAQMNGQQARPNPPQGQQNVNPLAQTQSMPVQKPQQKTQAPAESTSNRAARPPTNGRPTAQNTSPAQPAKNLKRASSDDVVEVPNPNLPQHQRPPNQQPQGQPQASQPPRPANFVNMSPPNLATLDPEARKRYEMSRAAQKPNPATNEQMLKLKSIAQEEEQRAREPVADLEMDSETKQAVASRVKEVAAPLKAVGSAIARWYQLTHDDQRARLFFRSRHRLSKQFRDPNMTQLKENFSIQLGEVDQIKGMLRTMLKDLSDNFPEMFKNKGAPQTANSQPAAAPAGQTMQAASVPLNAANLQQQQQQLSKMEQRSGSRGGGQTPAAPTSAQPPFHFGASSPHGQPAYIGKAGLTQDNLHIPARKKQKPNASAPGQTTPGSNASPLVKKGTSPEILKQQAPAQQAQQKAPLACSDPECEPNNTTFTSEEALHRHRQEEHIKIENPMQFAMDSLTSMLGVDPHGRPANVTGPELAAPSTAVNMATSGSKQGQTPNIKTGSTPMPAATPMNRQGSTTENKSNGPSKSKPDLSKDPSVKMQDDSTKQQSTMQAPETSVDAWANCTIDPNRLLETFNGFETGAGGAISDLNVYRSLTPNDTPESSKDSGVSEPNSDISDGVALDINLSVLDDSWQPFGPSDAEQLFNNSGNYNIDMDGGMDMLTFDDDKPIAYFEPLDNFDTSQFDKPFAFDTSLFSMNSE